MQESAMLRHLEKPTAIRNPLLPNSNLAVVWLPDYDCPMAKRLGKITFDKGASVWPHELKTAQALAVAGYDVLIRSLKHVLYVTKQGDVVDLG